MTQPPGLLSLPLSRDLELAFRPNYVSRKQEVTRSRNNQCAAGVKSDAANVAGARITSRARLHGNPFPHIAHAIASRDRYGRAARYNPTPHISHRTKTRFNAPTGITVTKANNETRIFVADTGNHRIRLLTLPE